MLVRCILGCVLLIFLYGSALAHGEKMTLGITLKKIAMVKSEMVRLTDIASLASAEMGRVAALKNVIVAKAPRVGYVERISREELSRILRGYRVTEGMAITFRGATAVNIQSTSQIVDAINIADAAVREAQLQLSGRFENVSVTVPVLPKAVNVPSGDIVMRVRPLDMTHLYARLSVWVDILVNGEIYRSVVVPINIKVEREVIVAVRDLSRGTEISEKDFSLRTEDVTGFPDIVEIAEIRKGTVRMRRSIARDRILTQQDIYPAGSVLKGDVIKLTYSNKSISLETTAIADQDAQSGEMIRVKPEKGMDMVMAKVISSRMVQVWEK